MRLTEPPESSTRAVIAAIFGPDRDASTVDREVLWEEVDGLRMKEHLHPSAVPLSEVLHFRFGANGERPMTLKAIGELYGRSPERVRQVLARALRMMRHPTRTRRYLMKGW